MKFLLCRVTPVALASFPALPHHRLRNRQGIEMPRIDATLPTISTPGGSFVQAVPVCNPDGSNVGGGGSSSGLTDAQLRASPVPVFDSNAVTLLNEINTDLGYATEPPPATDTASSGNNGRLQRIAQRITSLIALFPASLGAKTGAGSLSIVPATDATFSTSSVPGSAAASAIVPVTSQGVSSLVIKASPGNFFGAKMTSGATAGFFIAYNAVAAPAGAAAITASLVIDAIPVAANQTVALGDYIAPDRYGVGIVLLFSTSMTTMTAPANLATFMRGKAL